jgi:hypothetical protein
MTVLVGALCADGVVIGADSIATSTHGLHPLIQIRSDDKVITIGGQVIIATTGPVGLSQRFHGIVENCFNGGAFNTPCIQCMPAISAATIQDFVSTGVPRTPQDGFGFGAMLAAPIAGRHELIEFDHVTMQPERKTGTAHFVSMGSGQILADPFLAFVSHILWRGAMPTVKIATLGVHWTLSHAIQYAPGGIGAPIRIATLRNVNGSWRADLIQEDQMQEAAQHIGAIEERIGNYPAEIIEAASAAPIPAPPDASQFRE